MQIPNSIITIRLTDSRGYGPIIAPSYQAKVLRTLYRGKIDDSEGKGVLVEKYPDNGIDDTRYTEAYSVSSEMDRLRNLYKADSKGYYVDQAFSEKELSDEIVQLLSDEADRIAIASKPKIKPNPHQSYIDLGITADQAIALQVAGYKDRVSCVGVSLLDLNNVPGITLDVAKRLSLKDSTAKA